MTNPIKYKLYIAHRLATHWQGGYSKKDFDRTIGHLINQYEHKLIWKYTHMSTYKITFNSPTEVNIFKKELDYRLRLLHPKATYGWELVKPEDEDIT